MDKLSEVYLKGEENKAAILLMHSFGDTNGVMSPLAELLNQAGYSVLYPTYSNHQDQNYAEIFSTPMEDYQAEAAEYYQFLKAQGHDNIVVGGLSLGGILAIDLAVQHPEVSGLISLASPMFIDLNESKIPYYMRQQLYRQLATEEGISAEDRKQADQMFKTLKETFKTMNHWMDESLSKVLQLEQPVFIAQSVNDEVINMTVAERLKRAMRQAEFVDFHLYEEGTHYLTADLTLSPLAQDLIHFLGKI